MKLFLFTTDVSLAQQAAAGGVYSIIVDWEHKGKTERQVGHNLEINTDTPADVTRLKAATSIPITVRVNPVDAHSLEEINTALESGADIIMLPMARSAGEVATFLSLVNGRAKTLVQIETQQLVEDMESFVQLDWDFAYIGLNDLMISRGGTHIWEALADGTVEKITQQLAGRQYGFGGVTVVDGGIPLPFSLLVAEYARLGCELSFLRRTFKREVAGRDVVKELRAINHETALAFNQDQSTFSSAYKELRDKLTRLAKPVILVMYSTHQVSQQHINNLQQMAAGYEVVVAGSEAEALMYAPRTKIIFGHRYLRQVLEVAPHLRWVQSTAGGVDRLPLAELKNKKVVLSRSTLGSQPIAEHALLLLSNLQEKLLANYSEVSNSSKPSDYSNILIVGYGHIGQAIAKKLKSSSSKKYQVWGVKRKPLDTLNPLADQVFTDDSWQGRLSEVDAVMVALPITITTHQLLSKDVLKKLPAHALIINVGRGETVDEEYVISMLKNKKLAGYAADVVGPFLKQLAQEELEQHQNNLPLLLTGHVAAHHPDRSQIIEAFSEQQLDRYLHAKPLENIIEYHEY